MGYGVEVHHRNCGDFANLGQLVHRSVLVLQIVHLFLQSVQLGTDIRETFEDLPEVEVCTKEQLHFRGESSRKQSHSVDFPSCGSLGWC